MILAGNIDINIGLKAVWGIVKTKYIESIDQAKANNSLLRIYFDSDLDSPTEIVVEQACAASIYQSLKENLPDWKIADKAARSLGNFLGKLSVQSLDIAKLNYQFLREKIGENQYIHHSTKRTLATLAGIVDTGWVFMGNAIKLGISQTLQFFQVPENIARYTADKIHIGLCFLKSRIVNLIKSDRTALLFSRGIIKIKEGIKSIAESGKKIFEKVPPILKKVSAAVKEPVEVLYKSIKNAAEKVGETVKKVKGWLKRTFL
ncbi:MAG: hypothetical protein LUD15_06930 [Bacteroides sp.]|nr:hypothetical protein [Bacteroides sp.]